LQLFDDHLEYQNIKAKHIVFAEGFGMHANPFFNYLPLDGTKGELFIISAPKLNIDVIVNTSVFIIPLGNQLFKVGATYNWEDKTNIPTESAKKELTDNLKELIDCDFEIIEHFRGIGGVPTEPSFEDFLERVIPYMIQTHLEYATGTIDLILSIVSHSHFISEITGLKDIGNLDIVLQKLHLKYNKDNLGKINIDKQAGKLYHAIPIGSDMRFGEQDVLRCNRRFNSDKSACTWDITENGKVEINNSNANVSVNRCGDKVVEKIISKKDDSTQSTYVAPVFDSVVGGGKKRMIKLHFFDYF
jgi:predicted heme/steroid binding protein